MTDRIIVRKLDASTDSYDEHAGYEREIALVHHCRLGSWRSAGVRGCGRGGHHGFADAVPIAIDHHDGNIDRVRRN